MVLLRHSHLSIISLCLPGSFSSQGPRLDNLLQAENHCFSIIPYYRFHKDHQCWNSSMNSLSLCAFSLCHGASVDLTLRKWRVRNPENWLWKISVRIIRVKKIVGQPDSLQKTGVFRIIISRPKYLKFNTLPRWFHSYLGITYINFIKFFSEECQSITAWFEITPNNTAQQELFGLWSGLSYYFLPPYGILGNYMSTTLRSEIVIRWRQTVSLQYVPYLIMSCGLVICNSLKSNPTEIRVIVYDSILSLVRYWLTLALSRFLPLPRIGAQYSYIRACYCVEEFVRISFYHTP